MHSSGPLRLSSVVTPGVGTTGDPGHTVPHITARPLLLDIVLEPKYPSLGPRAGGVTGLWQSSR